MTPPAAPTPFGLLAARIRDSGRFNEILPDVGVVGPLVGGRYRHWNTVRRLDPPDGLTHAEWWYTVKLARLANARPLPLVDRGGRPFVYTVPDDLLRMLRRGDLDVGGVQSLPGDAVTPEQRDRFVRTSLVEEAITSSQLEGAATTRRVAAELIRTERRPRDAGERMILNNYRLMQRVRALAAEPLTPGLVVDLQRIATDGTLDPALQGLRQPGRDGDVAVYNHGTGALLHRPPDAAELPGRLAALCAFANAEDAAGGTFLHPALRAVALHFWLAYDHPFVDGNGRTARALFYWSMLRQGFWLAEFLSISRLLREAPAQYARSFLYVETDENDLTYFFLAQLRVLERATDDLRAYLARKQREMRETHALLTPGSGLNHRQVALLSHALRRPGQSYTLRHHGASHGVSYPTARKDLFDLAARGFLESRRLGRQGRALVFTAPADLGRRISEG